jgi:multiple sugar transport system substrate-binding protein
MGNKKNKIQIRGNQMRLSSKTNLLVVVLILCCFFTVGCGKKPADNTVTFAVGGAPAELEFWNELIKQFELQSGITVDLLRQPTDTDMRRQGLMTSLKSRKSRPDVFLMDVAWLGQFAASDWLEPLDKYMQAAEIDPNAFFEKVMKQADTYNGNLIALPVYVDGGVLYYRRDLLIDRGIKEPPQTWEKLLQYSKAIQSDMRRNNPDFYGFVFQGAQYEGLICCWLEFAASAGGGIVFENGNIKLNTPSNVMATGFMYQLIHKHGICPPNTFTEMKEEQVRTWFQSGDALFERNWPYAWPLHQQQDSPVRNKIDVAPLPHFGDGQSRSTLGGWHIGINTYSENKKAAFRLVQFVTSYQTQKKLAAKLGWNPGRADLYNDAELVEQIPHLPKLRKIFLNLHARPNVPYYTLISEILQRRINAVLSGKMTAAEAMAEAQAECSEVVQRYTQTD